MKLSYAYLEDGYAPQGFKIPDLPVVYLALKAGRLRARGPAIIDTGFDGEVLANYEVASIFRDVEPKGVVELESPLHGRAEFEVFEAEAYLCHEAKLISLGRTEVYVPTEPELLSPEVLIGRGRINEWKLNLDAERSIVEVELTVKERRLKQLY